MMLCFSAPLSIDIPPGKTCHFVVFSKAWLSFWLLAFSFTDEIVIQ
jgi:hypothetical protein